jgi:pimeloyl-ACP methyl ester carboxylesterase
MRRLPKLLRAALWGALALTLAVMLTVGTAMAYAAWRNEQLLNITTPNGIDEAMFVRIGGIDQWIQIRGQNRDNPVLLWLHGGPGFSTIVQTADFVSWEKDFTVVMWDQRGDGRTFEKYGRSIAGTMTMERMADDGIEVADYLRQHLKKDKIILLGHSWGSMLGIRMIAKRPDLFSVYVGTGQSVNLSRALEVSYPLILEKARALGNARAVAEIEAVGPPPYTSMQQWGIPIAWENRLDGPTPRLSFLRVGGIATLNLFHRYWWEGAVFSQQHMTAAMLAEDEPMIATRFNLPIVFIQGETDIVTPTVLAREYFDRIEAPKKEFVLLPARGHLAIFNARDDFLNALRAHVRPFALATQ